ncbi:MAG TPA: ABC transporter substrate-binding protein [Gaiellaceae bacterium]|nr:ABC transporter substrate-binding protein [Gaiellaceae bacterium]
MRRPFGRLTLVVAIAAAAAVVMTMGASAHSAKGNAVKSGGTLTVGWAPSFGVTDNFDPTGEYLGDAWGVLELEVRTLVNYQHLPGAAGNKIVPDLATSVPTPSNGGKTYTFHLKSNVKFSPPVSREITSQDVVTAMERLANPNDGGQYGFYYTVIKGWSAYAAATTKSKKNPTGTCPKCKISGITTPNATTVVFNLTQPTGDFLYRMAMPATGPMPAEVTKCFEGQPGKYAQDLIASGPYMLNGIDKVNISSCSTIKPDTSGYDGQTLYDVVRNPNYVQSTDPYRKNYPDEIRFTVDTNEVDVANKIEAGQLDTGTLTLPPDVLQKYATTPSLKPYFHQDGGDRTWYLTMNTTQPPFDDIHVRRAMNWLMDKAALVQAWGGPTIGSVANHIVPDTLFNNQLSEYAPYKTAGNHGSAAKAMAAMKGSKYDTSNNGMCDAAQCKNILLLADTRIQDPKMVSIIEADGAKIGLTFKVQTINGAYPALQTVAKNIPIGERPGWGKDYADPYTFFGELFDGRAIIPTGNTNYSLLGITAAQCKALKVTGDCSPYNAKTGLGVPSVNSQLDKCAALLGRARLSCFENLDKYMMANVVPWVPYLNSFVTRITSSNVTKYAYDQFTDTPAYENMAVK